MSDLNGYSLKKIIKNCNTPVYKWLLPKAEKYDKFNASLHKHDEEEFLQGSRTERRQMLRERRAKMQDAALEWRAEHG